MLNRKPALLLILILLTPLLSGCAGILIGGIAVGAAVAHDRRTTGSYVEDQNIELKALERLSNNKSISKGGSISITSYNQIVLITGQIESEEAKANVEQLIKSIKKIKRVVNELEIGSTATVSETARDSYITAEAKISLLGIGLDGFDTTKVKFKTERGVVYLMGMVTQQEADTVVQRIRAISGVRKVVKVFEYL